MSANLFDIQFTADTATAVAAVNKLEAELIALRATAASVGGSALSAGTGLATFAENALTATTHVGQMNVAMQHNSTTVTRATSSILEFGAAFQVLANILPLVSNLGELFNKQREAIDKMTEKAEKLLDTLREIANLQGKGAPNDEVAADVLKLGMTSGMTPDDARKFTEQFLGSIPAGKQKGNITDQVAGELMDVGASFGVRVGINAKTAGDFAGVMSQYGKVPSAEAGAQVMGRVVYGLNEGRGNVEPLMRTLLNTAGSVVGENGAPMESLEELAVMEGVASTHANPYATGTRLRQAVRALRVTKGPEAEWLAQHGVRDGMSHRERLKAIKPHILEEAKRTGKGIDQVLKMHVTDDDSVARSIAEQMGDTDLMDARMDIMQGITGRDVIAKNREFLASGVGQKRLANAEQAAQEYVIGQKGIARDGAGQRAEMQLRDEGQIGGGMNVVQDFAHDLFGGHYLVGNMSYRDKQKLARSTGNLVQEARKKGMSEEEIFGKEGLDNGGVTRTPAMFEGTQAERTQAARDYNSASYLSTWGSRSEKGVKDDYDRLALQVPRRGGDVYGGGSTAGKTNSAAIENKLDRLVDETKKTNDILRQNQQRNPNVLPPPVAAGLAPPARCRGTPEALTMIALKATVHGDDAILAKLRQIASELGSVFADPAPIQAIVADTILAQMDQECDPDGLPWPPLSAGYHAYKDRVSPGSEMGRLFGAMKEPANLRGVAVVSGVYRPELSGQELDGTHAAAA